MTPLNNNYLVRPDAGVGASIEAVGDDRWHLPIKGIVVAIPDRINSDWKYLHWARKRYNKSYPGAVLAKMRHIVGSTTEVNPILSVNVGDRVMFSFIVHRNTSHEGHEGLLLVHSDELICKIDPVQPLNGYLLVRMDENDGLKDRNNYGTATVVYAAPCAEYRDGGVDDDRIVPGSKVAFLRSSCVRMEANEFNTLNPGGFSSLFRVRRKDVLSFS